MIEIAELVYLREYYQLNQNLVVVDEAAKQNIDDKDYENSVIGQNLDEKRAFKMDELPNRDRRPSIAMIRLFDVIDEA